MDGTSVLFASLPRLSRFHRHRQLRTKTVCRRRFRQSIRVASGRRENRTHLSFRWTRQSSDDDPRNETDHSATFLSAFYVYMMRNFLPCLKLCLLCCALAQRVGLTCAVQRALLRSSDAVSAADGSPPRAPSHLSNGAVLHFRLHGRQTAAHTV